MSEYNPTKEMIKAKAQQTFDEHGPNISKCSNYKKNGFLKFGIVLMYVDLKMQKI